MCKGVANRHLNQCSENCRCAKFMASDTGKKLIQIDVSSDTVCPWCFVGKKNLEKAMEQSKDKFDFEVSLSSNPHHVPVSEQNSCLCSVNSVSHLLAWKVRWHPFFLNPDAPKEGIRKSEFYKRKFGPEFERATSRMTEVPSRDLCLW